MFKARHSLTEIPKIFSKENESIHHMKQKLGNFFFNLRIHEHIMDF